MLFLSVWTAEQLDLLDILKQSAITTDDKFKILDARDKLIRLRTKKHVDLSKAKATVGTCSDMCPEKERLMREIQHQVFNSLITIIKVLYKMFFVGSFIRTGPG